MNSTNSMKILALKKDEDRRIRAGHLWVFSNEVDIAKTALKYFSPGEFANLQNSRGQSLGTVYVNPASLIAARLVSHRPNTPWLPPFCARAWNRPWPCGKLYLTALITVWCTRKVIYCQAW